MRYPTHPPDADLPPLNARQRLALQCVDILPVCTEGAIYDATCGFSGNDYFGNTQHVRRTLKQLRRRGLVKGHLEFESIWKRGRMDEDGVPF